MCSRCNVTKLMNTIRTSGITLSPFPPDFSEECELLLIPDSYGPIIENQAIISVRRLHKEALVFPSLRSNTTM